MTTPDPAAKPAPRATEPQLIAGRYQVFERLGAGGMATVYLARTVGPAGTGKLVAIKRIHPHLANEERFVHMFLDEWRIAADITHPNVCSVLEWGQTSDTYYLAMEYIMGETLLSFLAKVQKEDEILDSDEWHWFVAHSIAEAAEGLHAAHELRDEHGQLMNVIHRDVSPDNIFVTYNGAVKVTDFGVARAKGQIHETQSGTIKGKFGYMAPEVLYGDVEFDRRVDVWALGVCLWELLCGKRLFRREAEAATISAIVNDPIPKPSDERPKVPPELDEIVMGALSREADNRPATARELGNQLREFVRQQGQSMDLPRVAEFARRIHPDELRKKQALRQHVRATGSVTAQTLALPEELGLTPKPELVFAPANSEPQPAAPPQSAPQAVQPAPAAGAKKRRGSIAAIALAVVGAAALGAVGAVELMGGQGGEAAGQTQAAVAAGAVDDEPAVSGLNQANGQSDENGQSGAASPTDKPDREVERPDTPAADTPAADAPNSMIGRKRPRTTRRPRGRTRETKKPAESTNHGPRSSDAEPSPASGDEPATGGSTATTIIPPVHDTTDLPKVDPHVPTPKPDPKPEPPKITSFAAKAHIGSVKTKGSLSRAQMRGVIDRNAGSYGQCYEKSAKKAHRIPASKLDVTLEIDESGFAQNVRVTKSSLPGLSACVQKVSRKVRSRRPPDVGGAKVSFRVTFDPEGD